MMAKYLKEWETPSHYVGHNPTGDYVLHAIARDASILDQSNHVVWLELCAKHDPECAHWYTFRASHWAVGWIEYLILKHDAPVEFVHACEELECTLASYPVACDETYARLQWEAVEEYWEDLNEEDQEEIAREAREYGEEDPLAYLLHYTDMFH